MPHVRIGLSSISSSPVAVVQRRASLARRPARSRVAAAPYLPMLDSIAFNEAGLVPAIAQDADSGEVLMLAWMNRDAVEETVRTGQAVYFSRSRGRLWRKGESSGHVQKVRELRLDCDGDTLLLRVEQAGGIACHTGRRHCFYRRLANGAWQVVEAPVKDPAAIYGDGGPLPDGRTA